MSLELTVADTLPEDRDRAVLVGRAWLPGAPGGPAVVTVRGDRLVDITGLAPTCSELLNRPSACAGVRSAAGRDIGGLAASPTSSRRPSCLRQTGRCRSCLLPSTCKR